MQTPCSEFKLASKSLALLSSLSWTFQKRGICRPQAKGHPAEESSHLISLKLSARDQASECDIAWGSTLHYTPRGSILKLLVGTDQRNKQFRVERTLDRPRKKKCLLISNDRLVYNPLGLVNNLIITATPFHVHPEMWLAVCSDAGCFLGRLQPSQILILPISLW